MRLNARKLIDAMLATHDPAEKLPTDAGIYAIVNRRNGRVYIGSAVNIRARMVHHRSQLRSGRHSNRLLDSDWADHGEASFVVGVLRLCHPWDRSIIERELTEQVLGPNCYNWSSAGQKSRYLGHPAIPGSGLFPPPSRGADSQEERPDSALPPRKSFPSGIAPISRLPDDAGKCCDWCC